MAISNGLKYTNEDYKIAVVYKGNSAPNLVLENQYSYSWDINIKPCETPEAGVAYYSYNDIKKAFSKHRVSIYDMGKLIIFPTCYTEIYGVYAAPV